MEGNNKSKFVLSIVIIIGALLLGGVSYYLYQDGFSLPFAQPQPQPQEGETTGETDTQDDQDTPVEMPEPEIGEDEAAVYFVDVENKRGVEETFGCDDSISYLVRPLEGTDLSTEEKITQSIGYLVAENDRYVGKGGLYNALHSSDLTVDRVVMEGSTAQVYITGELSLGGVCDNPRVEKQLTETITQFDVVEATEIYVNEEPLDTFLSGQGS